MTYAIKQLTGAHIRESMRSAETAYVVTCSGHLGVDGLTSDTVDGVLWLAQGRLGFALPARVRGEDGWYCYRSQEDADNDPDGSGAALVVERAAEAS